MRIAHTWITEAELAHLVSIVEQYRHNPKRSVLRRQVATIAAKTFLVRAAKALPLSDAEVEELAPRVRRIA